MADFINSVDVLGDAEVASRIVSRTITEYNDNNVSTVGLHAFRGCAELLSVDIPFATIIDGNAFRECTKITSVHAPAVLSTGINAFYSCPKLETVDLPSATHIEMYTFQACTNLVNVDIRNALTIGNSAFEGCTSLTRLDLYKVKSLGDNAFYKCTALTDVIIRNTESICSFGKLNSLGSVFTAKVYVPAALIDSYKTATNWSTYANQFRKLEDWTVDGTVTGELDVTNRRMVRFFNDDGTLLGYKVVTVGSDATYDGTPVCSEDASWEFTGFEPSPVNVTADMDCYAKYKEPFRFSNASWEDIVRIAEAGEAQNYFALGDRKPLTYISSQYGTTTTEGVVQIVAFDRDELSDGTGKAAMSLLVVHDGVYMNLTNSGSNYESGWPNCALRTRLNNTVLNSLPEELKSAVKSVKKTTYGYNGTIHATDDYLWPPSVGELGATKAAGGSYEVSGEGDAYEGIHPSDFSGALLTDSAPKFATRSQSSSHMGVSQVFLDNYNSLRYEGLSASNGKSIRTTFGFCI